LAKSPKSHLLEKLRAQAESVSAKRVEQQQLSREVVERVDRRLHAIFTPGALDTEALDDLVNLMLGKPNQFLLRAPLRGFGR
jgi:hypothetical protein